MSVRYNDDFKKEVVRSYTAGNKSTVEIAVEYNIAKSSVSEWAKKYGKEFQYKNTTQNASESDSIREIRRFKLHSDQGQQVASWEFVMFCKEQGITQSMSKAFCHNYSAK
ncbi:transposase [Lachnospiraceae bacterium LCP25S3_G4]